MLHVQLIVTFFTNSNRLFVLHQQNADITCVNGRVKDYVVRKDFATTYVKNDDKHHYSLGVGLLADGMKRFWMLEENRGRNKLRLEKSGSEQAVIVVVVQTHRVGRDISVGIVTRYGLDGLGSNPGGAKFSAPVQTGSGAHPSPYKMGTGSLSLV